MEREHTSDKRMGRGKKDLPDVAFVRRDWGVQSGAMCEVRVRRGRSRQEKKAAHRGIEKTMTEACAREKNQDGSTIRVYDKRRVKARRGGRSDPGTWNGTDGRSHESRVRARDLACSDKLAGIPIWFSRFSGFCFSASHSQLAPSLRHCLPLLVAVRGGP